MLATRGDSEQPSTSKCSNAVDIHLNPRPSTPDLDEDKRQLLVERLFSHSSAASPSRPRQLHCIPSLGAPAAFKRVCMFGGIVRVTADTHTPQSLLYASATLQDDLAILRYVCGVISRQQGGSYMVPHQFHQHPTVVKSSCMHQHRPILPSTLQYGVLSTSMCSTEQRGCMAVCP